MATLVRSPKAHPEDVGVQTLVADVAFDTLNIGSANGITIGTLPNGAVILRTSVFVTTAFNAATTNVLTVGRVGGLEDLMASATAVAGTAGAKVQNGRATGVNPVSGDTNVQVRYTQSGTAATAGRALVVVEFYPAADYAA